MTNEKKREKEEIDYEEKYKRMKADFQNYKKRQEEEREEIKKQVNKEILKEVLRVKRKINNIKNKDDLDEKDLKIIESELNKIINSRGIEEISTNGKYDPEKHRVILKEKNEEYDSGEIIKVVKQGYQRDNNIIEEAEVIVSE